LGIEVGRADEKQPALAIFPGNCIEQTAIDVVCDQIGERLRVRQRTTSDQQRQRLLDDQFVVVATSSNRRELFVVTRSEESKGRD
jgi:hypothetical protein